ncbi:protein kinase, partial [bacterium]|nr:protein kinase [bacterium]
RAALELLNRSREVALVLLDLSLPDKDGLQILGRIRQHYDLMQLPVILVSADSDTHSMVEALELGANDYLTKPVQPLLLVAKVRRHLTLAHPPAPLPGQELRVGGRAGPYEILALLGEGAHGRVFRARDVRLQREVAIKVWAGSGGPEQLDRLSREALAIARVSHPNVVTIFDVGDQPQPFIAMELLQGRPLDQLALPLPVAQACEWTGQLLDGLEAVHRVGLIHGDLKPANVMVGCDGRLRLMDFGVARWDQPNSPSLLEGTPPFWAPEQLDPRLGGVGPRSDLFAIGGLLYWLLAGKLPFPASIPSQQAFTILFGTPHPLSHLRPEVGQDLQLVVDRALCKDPGQRYGSAAEFAQALRKLPMPN